MAPAGLRSALARLGLGPGAAETDDGDAYVLAHMRVGVAVGRTAVGGPAGVADPGRGVREGVGAEQGLQIGELASLLADLEEAVAALFARPLVVSPTSVVALELGERSEAILSADGRRMIDVAPNCRIEVRQHPRPIRFARLATSPFTDRLVAKFELPVDGWRGRRADA